MKEYIFNHPKHRFTTREEDIATLNHFKQLLSVISNLSDIDAYVLNYKENTFEYITPGSRLLKCTPVKVPNALGFDYYKEIVHPKDFEFLIKINRTGFDFFYNLPITRRKNGYITYNFRIKNKNGKYQIVNHKLTPLQLTNEGAIVYSLCVLSEPTSDSPGNAYVKMNDTLKVYEFLPDKMKFVEVVTQKLSQRLYELLKFASQGKKAKEIAELMRISVNTVKFHKKTIFEKTGTKNIAEAIQWMNNQKLMMPSNDL
ncbi:regulatory protein, luxR family [Mariniphaga anaerophila]|uniref:Regulatory protein, luxR family n=1 Tax=Mariniphaga anaerophila TaxID=1484053 RepID=A0A1M5BVC5_9BACT|nr:helix-turn-helix transcriptional regulator [Mariniphaga anaerophila]SHF46513.1 regulatory protein, luxR family [Mariniphaga anaerophila]